MALLRFIRDNDKPASAALAKERLQIIVAHERRQRPARTWLPQLKLDILQVISKYVCVDEENVTVQLEQKEADLAVLELNIVLPEQG